jgi:tetratricopeptide (TPR) repeat protein
MRLGVDLAGHMRRILRWYHDARGRVSLQAGRAAEAVTDFQALLSLDPEFKEAYLPLARALKEAGKLEQALKTAGQAEKIFQSQPEQLKQVRELYQSAGLKDDVARVDKRLAHLRPSLARPAAFACGLTLMGYDLTQAAAKPGDKLDISYYWRTEATPPVNYHIFVHLKGQGRIITFDHLLDHGRQPMTELRPGQVVRESYQLTIPKDAAPGRYQLLIGLWDSRFSGKRVLLTGKAAGADEASLTTLEIGK